MVKTGIKVVVRVRPTPDFASSAIQLAPDKQVRSLTPLGRNAMRDVQLYHG